MHVETHVLRLRKSLALPLNQDIPPAVLTAVNHTDICGKLHVCCLVLLHNQFPKRVREASALLFCWSVCFPIGHFLAVISAASGTGAGLKRQNGDYETLEQEHVQGLL